MVLWRREEQQFNIHSKPGEQTRRLDHWLCHSPTYVSATLRFRGAGSKCPHSYPTSTTATYTPYFESCCRIGALRNNANGSWRLSTRIKFDIANKSPISTGLPIVPITDGRINRWVVPSIDPDNDVLTFKLAPTNEMKGSQPSGMSVDSSTGLISFQPSGSSRYKYYCTQLQIEDKNTVIGIDYLLEVRAPSLRCSGCSGSSCPSCSSDSDCSSVGCSKCVLNVNPVFVPPTPWLVGALPSCFVPGRSSQFDVVARDDDACDFVTITAGGLPAGSNFAKTSGSNPVTYTFTWTPSNSQKGQFYLVPFQAYDNGNGASSQEFVRLNVPENSGAYPTVTSASPSSGLDTGGTAVSVKGGPFNNNPDLQCKFVGGGQTVVNPPVFLSSSEIICVMPSKSTMGSASSVSVHVANLASCDEYVLALQSFTYITPCSGSGCSGCPIGRYISGSNCVDCPAGRYGNEVDMTSSECSGPCAQGYYCPQGSTTPTNPNFKCPPGTYGGTTGLQSSACSGPCPPGYFCLEGTVTPSNLCPTGRFGGEGERNNQCRGPCQAGYYCERGATEKAEHECGGVDKFCPEGSGEPQDVLPGYYTTGNTVKTRSGQAECDAGFYCVGGQRTACPAGRYQSTTGSVTQTCEGPCQAGFFCLGGASSPTQSDCAPVNDPNPAKYFCPEGTSTRRTVQPNYYTGPESSLPTNREYERPCPSSDVCENGIRRPKLDFTGACNDHRAGTSIDENTSGTNSLFTISANSNVPSPAKFKLGSVTRQRVDNQLRCSVANPFRLASDGRTLEITQAIDHEPCPGYEVEMVAYLDNDPTTITCVVTVNIRDVNEDPVIAPNSFTFSINENSPRNSLVGEPLSDYTSDPDEGQEKIYSLVSGDSSRFKVTSCSGQIVVLYDEALDFEDTSEYTLVIKVRDDGSPVLEDTATVTVKVLDVDEAPFFVGTPYSFTIDENSGVGASVTGTVVTDDPDADKSKTLSVRGDGAGFFEVLSDGTIRTKFNPNHETTSSFVITVRVVDATNLMAETDVTIAIADVNDAPVVAFNGASYSVPEDKAGGFVLATGLSSTDEDLPQQTLTYSTTDTAFEFFRAGSDSVWQGSLRLKNDASLDYETKSSYVLSVDVTDNGSPPQTTTVSVAVQVLDVNEAPVITINEVFIDENSPVGTATDAPMTAVDPDLGQTLFWSILTSDSKFSIDALTGEIRVSNPTLDYETQSSYSLSVRVRDNGSPVKEATETVTVRLRDLNEPPYWETQSLTVDENSGSGVVVATIRARDYDSGDEASLTYDFVPGLDSGSFTVEDSVGGECTIKVKGTSTLDFESRKTYYVDLRATDAGGLSAVGRVLITLVDVPENPSLGDTNYSVPELADPGSPVGPRLNGFDQDAGQTATLTYSMSSRSISYDGTTYNSGDYFSLSSDGTFNIIQKIPSHHNYLAEDFIFLIDVTVTDVTGRTDTALVRVFVAKSNEPPIVTPKTIQVPEDEPTFSALLDISATDNNQEQISALQYEIHRSYPSGFEETFEVTRGQPGTFSLGPRALDFETVNSYTIEVLVQDNGEVGSTPGERINRMASLLNVTVTVTDVNEQPQVTADSITIPENSEGDTGLQISMYDDDKGQTHSWSYSPSDGTAVADWPFTIDNNGKVFIKNGAVLDFETKATYTGTVSVVDSGTPTQTGEATVVINLSDVNEPPECFNADFQFLENQLGVVGTVQSADQDSPSGPRGQRDFSIVGGNHKNSFSISPDGSISVALSGGLDFEDIPEFGLTIQVADRGSPALTDNCDVTVTVINVNDLKLFTVGGDIPHPTNANGEITFSGANLGFTDFVPNRPAPTISAVYIHQPSMKKGSVSCSQSNPGDNTEIRCPLPTGTGVAMWNVTVNDDLAVYPVPTRYATPSITGVVSAGAIPTAGDSQVFLEGQNFGPSGTVVLVTYGPEAARVLAEGAGNYITIGNGPGSLAGGTAPASDYILETPRCAVSQAHTTIRCTTAPGVGTHLGWSITVGGQQSERFVPEGPRASYARPVISNMQVLSTPGGSPSSVQRLDTRGGQSIRIKGSNFGPGPVDNFHDHRVTLTYGHTGDKYFSNCTVVKAHTEIECISAPGVGGQMEYIVHVGAQMSDNFDGLSYRRPTILGVSGPGSWRGNTEGNEDLIITGDFFGPVGGIPRPRVYYGHPSGSDEPESLRYEAADCKVIEGGQTKIACKTVEGTGNGHVVSIRLDDQKSPSPFDAQMSYHPPLINFFVTDAGPAWYEGSTEGGELIEIEGQHFGPYDHAEILAEYSHPEEEEVFTAECEVDEENPHVRLRCISGEGAGEGLIWKITVDGQESLDATTKYNLPTILGFSGEAASGAITDGFQEIILEGQDFGPPTAPDYLEWVKYGPSALEYTAINCSVLSHTRISCLTIPGAGSELTWMVRLKGQEGPKSPTWSYAAPMVDQILNAVDRTEPVGFTAGERIVIVGSNFGLDVGRNRTGANQTVVFRGGTQNADIILPILEMRNLGGVHELEVEVPPGYGTGYSLVVHVDAIGPPRRTTAPAAWDYSGPVLEDVLSFENDGNTIRLELLGHSFCEPPPSSVSSDEDDDVSPRSGPNALGFFGCGEVQLSPLEEENWSSINSNSVLEYSHKKVVILTPDQGRVRIVVGGRASSSLEFTRLPPVFSGREALEEKYANYRFHTDGGEVLSFTIRNACEDMEQLTVFVGDLQNRECKVFNLTKIDSPSCGSSCTECDVECRMPFGDGVNQPVVIKTVQRSPNNFTVNFRSPNVTAAYLGTPNSMGARVSAPLPGFGRPGSLRFIIPTTGGPVTLQGWDFGLTPFKNYNPQPQSNCLVQNNDPNSKTSKISQARLVVEPALSLMRSGPATAACGANVQSTVMPGAPAPNAAQSVSAERFLSTMFPEGSGRGFQLVLTVGSQTTDMYLAVDYARPVVQSVSPNLGRTLGGELLTITGKNFGTSAMGTMVNVTIGGRPCILAGPFTHSQIKCYAPEGGGRNNLVLVEADNQLSCQHGGRYAGGGSDDEKTSCAVGYSYRAPSVSSSSVVGNVLETKGGAKVWITGENFGVEPPLVLLVPNLENERARTMDLTYMLSVNTSVYPPAPVMRRLATPSRGLQSSAAHPLQIHAVPSASHNGYIQFYNRTHLMFTMPEGQGEARSVRVISDGQLSPLAGAPSVGYAPPQLKSPAEDAVVPKLGSTLGFDVRIDGSNFGRLEPHAEPIDTGLFVSLSGGSIDDLVSIDMDTEFDPTPAIISNATNSMDLYGIPWKQDGANGHGGIIMVVDLPGRQQLEADGKPGIVFCRGSTQYTGQRSTRYTHNYMYCLMPAGFGSGYNFTINLDGRLAVVKEGEELPTVGYRRPELDSIQPNAVNALGSERITLEGDNYGTRTFGVLENHVEVILAANGYNLDPKMCNLFFGTEGGEVFFEGRAKALSPNTTSLHRKIKCSTQTDYVGSKNVTLTAGTYTERFPGLEDHPRVYKIQFQCARGYYGQVGEQCVECPPGAVCEGPVCLTEDSTNECLAFKEPYSREGWWRTNLAANHPDCPITRPSRSGPYLERLPNGPLRGTCPVFLPCEPLAACAGDNQCARGYMGERCSECDNTGSPLFYRVGGECVECPDTAWVYILLGVVGLVGGCIAFYYLSKIMSLALLSIGIDYFQILAMFARSKIKWHPLIKDLLLIFSAFNLNLDLAAPECSIPDLGFEFKWFAIMLLPLIIAAVLAIIFLIIFLYGKLVKGRNRKEASWALPHLASYFLVAMYLLYLFVSSMTGPLFSAKA